MYDTVDFNVDNATTSSFKIKEKITNQADNNDTKDVKTPVPLKHLSNFWNAFK